VSEEQFLRAKIAPLVKHWLRALWRELSRRRCPRCQQRVNKLETMCYLCAHGGDECLQMVREDLEAYGVDMSATPPMMYNDAMRSLVAKLALKAGFTDTREIAAYIRGSVSQQERSH
jgi:predicted amidophosphoribosyltransferase